VAEKSSRDRIQLALRADSGNSMKIRKSKKASNHLMKIGMEAEATEEGELRIGMERAVDTIKDSQKTTDQLLKSFLITLGDRPVLVEGEDLYLLPKREELPMRVEGQAEELVSILESL
jgi:hypothetical protein